MYVTQEELAIEFGHAAAKAPIMARELARKFSVELLNKIKENASGPPGPDIMTGMYIESIYVDVFTSGTTISLFAGSNADQANRLEYGFVGIDASGRKYNDPPRPHFRPAADSMAERWEEVMADAGDLDKLRKGM
jgi:hypothetical protein